MNKEVKLKKIILLFEDDSTIELTANQFQELQETSRNLIELFLSSMKFVKENIKNRASVPCP